MKPAHLGDVGDEIRAVEDDLIIMQEAMSSDDGDDEYSRERYQMLALRLADRLRDVRAKLTTVGATPRPRKSRPRLRLVK